MSQSKYAILIGSSEFPDARAALPALPCAATDVHELQSVLSDPQLSAFDDVQVALDLPHWEVMLRINKVMRKASREDQILLYYSGHGLLDSDGKLHLATVNTQPEHLHATTIPGDNLRALIRETRCRRIIILLDCCFAAAAGDQLQVDRLLDDSFHASGDTIDKGYAVSVIAAAAADQAAYAPDDGSTSFMTGIMIEAIRSGRADRNYDGVITIEEVYDDIRREMRQRHGTEPVVFNSGFTGSLTIANSPLPVVWADVVARIGRRIATVRPTLTGDGGNPAAVNILDRALEILELPEHEVLRSYEALLSLLKDWSHGRLSLDALTDQWYQFDKTDLAATDRVSDTSGLAEHWDIVRQARAGVLDLINPAYILDRNFHILDWNIAFDAVLAKQMGLIRFRHVEDFVLRLDNHREVIERSQRLFSEERYPLVDIEDLIYTSPHYGKIVFKKIAAQVPDSDGEILAWSVSLNIIHADKADELWHDLHARLNDEVNWSIYAKLYDRMLSRFDAYRELINKMVTMVGPAQTVADLGAGTGNVLVELLRQDAGRNVLAVESNEEMLNQLRAKFYNGLAAEAQRVRLFKGDIIESLREVDDNMFDAVIMVNVLYAMPNRARCLREIYRVLRPGGVVVYSTSTSSTDVDRLFDAIRAEMAAKGLLHEMTPVIDLAYDRHQEMIDNILHDDEQAVVDYALRAGFDVCDDDVLHREYTGAVTIVRATKPDYLPDAGAVLKPRTQVTVTDQDETCSPADRIPQLFISYAHEDSDWCKQIMKYLQPAVDANTLRIWADPHIDPGRRWDDEIEQNLKRSAIAVLLVTPSFLASDYIKRRELPLLLAQRARDETVIIPVPVERGMIDQYRVSFDAPDGRRRKLTLSDIQFMTLGDRAVAELETSQQKVFIDKLARYVVSLAADAVVAVEPPPQPDPASHGGRRANPDS